MTSEAGSIARNLAPSTGRSWAIALRNTENRAGYFMCHIMPLRGLGFSKKILLSSVACGDTPFQRKKAFALHHAALMAQKGIP